MAGCFSFPDLTLTTIANGTIALTATATNYLYVDATGTVTKATSAPSGWPAPLASNAIALYQIVTDGAGVTSYTDYRTRVRGLQGPTGATGAAGATGATGPTGATGATGATGPTGATGAAGVNGSTWYSGSGAPASGTGVNGDYYLNTANGDVYKKAAGAWGSPIENLTGPTGATGATGAAGGAADIAATTHAATGKTTPVDADEIPIVDSAASNVLKKLTWANLKATLKTYFDTLYIALSTVNVFTKNQCVTPVALTDGATISVDASLSNNFYVTLGGNRTLANPTNLTAGMVLNFQIDQDATGSRTLAFGNLYKFPGGTNTISTAASAKDFISCYYDGAVLRCNLSKAYA
jgi:hypothetical protein